jgi:hypothetical protein
MPATRIWDGASNSVFATAGNWSADTAPVAGDTAIMPDGNIVAVTGFTPVYAQALAEFTAKAGYSGALGSRTAGVISDVMIQATTVNLAGSGVAYVNLTTVTTCNVTGAAAGTPTTGSYGLALSGATITTLNIDLEANQSVGVAALAGQTSTATTIAIDGYGTVVLGEGLTTTTITIAGSGTVYIRCAFTTLTVSGTPTIYHESGAGTTLVCQGGTFYANSTGLVGTTSIYPGAVVKCTDGPQARTFTTISNYGGLFDDTNKLATWTTLNRYCGDECFLLGANWKQVARQSI